MSKKFKIIALVLVFVTILGCISVFAAETATCSHSSAEAWVSSKTARGNAYNSLSGYCTAYVYGTYNKANDYTIYNFYGSNGGGYGSAYSESYNASASNYRYVYDEYSVNCPSCGGMSGVAYW